MPQTIEFEGTTHVFPDDFTQQDISKALAQAHPGPPGGTPPPPAKPPLPQGLAPGTQVPGNSLADRYGRLSGSIDTSRIEQSTEADKAPFRQIGQGVSTIKNAPDWNTRAQGTSDVLRGGLGVAAKTLPALAPMAPVSTAVGLAAGTAAGYGTEKGLEAVGVPQGYSELAGTVAGIGAGGLSAKAVGPLNTPFQVDPHIAALRAWQFEKDPRILDQIKSGDVKLTSGLSDLKATGVTQNIQNGYANEAVLDHLPAAKDANRAAWDQWMARARGQVRMGTPIIQATADALKSTINDPRAQAIIEEANRQYDQPLTPDDMYRLLEEKNGELKSFYSSSKEVQAAAERAGADTLKNKALLEAQARALRNMLYQTLDPEGGGMGPAEIQGRYGALKAIEEAANARRTSIIQEHPVNPMERVAGVHLDPRAAIKAKQGSSEWLIENAIGAAPDPTPLPRPTGMYPMNARAITSGPMVTPPPADTSYVRGVPLAPHQQINLEPRMLPAPTPGQPPINILPRGPAGTPYPMPPAGTSDLLDRPGRPLGLPAPTEAAPRTIRAMPAPGEPFPAEATRPETAPPPGQTIGGNVAQRLGKAIWDAIKPQGTAE